MKNWVTFYSNIWSHCNLNILSIFCLLLNFEIYRHRQLFVSLKLNFFCSSHALWPDWAIFCTLGTFLKPLAPINLPKSPTFLGNFCKGVKIYHFSSEIIFGQILHMYIRRFFSDHTDVIPLLYLNVKLSRRCNLSSLSHFYWQSQALNCYLDTQNFKTQKKEEQSVQERD